jgi:hypothetical protein
VRLAASHVMTFCALLQPRLRQGQAIFIDVLEKHLVALKLLSCSNKLVNIHIYSTAGMS